MTGTWIKHPVVLEGTAVDLLPLERIHFAELWNAGSDRRLWEFTPSDGSVRERFLELYAAALTARDDGREYPFVIRHRPTGRLIGSTRFLDIVPGDRKLEIGWSWLMIEYWGTGINAECKFLLLEYCFGTLHTLRVQLKTDETNLRSRRAIEKIGARFEGIHRMDRIKDNGKPRNTAYYSIIGDEWPAVREHLRKFIAGRQSATR